MPGGKGELYCPRCDDDVMENGECTQCEYVDPKRVPITPELLEQANELIRQTVMRSVSTPGGPGHEWAKRINAVDPDYITLPAEIVPPPLDLQRVEKIKLRVQLASENRLLTPLHYYQQDITYLLNQLGVEIEDA